MQGPSWNSGSLPTRRNGSSGSSCSVRSSCNLACRGALPRDSRRFSRYGHVLTAVRLELARAYYLAGIDDKARYHFSLSQAEELPSSVEAVVEEFLRRIDARKRWSVSVSASMRPETERPQHETVLIGNVPFRLDDEARSSSGTGCADIRRRLVLAEDFGRSPRSTRRIGRSRTLPGSQWDDVNASSDIGLARLFDNGSVSAGVRLGRRWTGDKATTAPSVPGCERVGGLRARPTSTRA